MTSVCRSVLGLPIVLAALAVPASPAVAQRRAIEVPVRPDDSSSGRLAPPTGCRAVVTDRYVLRAREGGLPWVSISGQARYAEQWLLTGSPAMVWPDGATASFVPATDAFIGFVLKRRDTVRMVPNPLPGRRVLFPRVATAPRGWHALLFESPSPDDGRGNPSDTVTIWYGEYSGRRWHRVQRVASLTRARFRDVTASHLVVDDRGALAFAYPLGRNVDLDSPDRPGVVLLHRSGVAWRADTLATPFPVAYVSLVPGARRDSWRVMYQMMPPLGHSDGLGWISLVAFDGAWRARELAVMHRTRGLTRGSLLAVGRDLFATWTQDRGVTTWGKQVDLRWSPLMPSATMVAETAPIIAPLANEYVVVQFPDQSILWSVRDSLTAESVRLQYARGAMAVDAGAVSAPNHASWTVVPLADRRALLLTARIDETPGAIPVQQVATRLELNCS